MNQFSFLVMAFGVINLLLVSTGALLVFFDWSAARNREFLYLYFTDERPGANFFYAAKRRRAQFSRLSGAFIILLLQQIFLLWVYAGLSEGNNYSFWLSWWQTGESHPAIDGIVGLYPWLYFTEIAGLGLLAFGLLYPIGAERIARHDTLTALFLAAWAVFAVTTVIGVYDDAVGTVVRNMAMLVRTVIAALAIGFIWQRGQAQLKADAPSEGSLPFKPNVMIMTFGLWWLGHALGMLFRTPVATALFTLIALSPLVVTIARSVLAEYESVESSRHRMGRERSVIFSFLQRIGNAFSSAVEVDEVLNIVLDSALKTTEACAGAIYLYRRDTKTLEPRLVNSFFPPLYVDTPAVSSDNRTADLEDEMKHQAFNLGEGIIGEVAQSGQARLVHDVHADGIMLGSTTEYMRNRSMLVVPLRIRDEPLGVMAVLNKQRGSFGREDQSLLQALGDQGALSIQYAMLTNEARQQERLRRELQIAREIQQHLLPDRCPAIPGFQIAGRAISATEVGGDYYDFVSIDEDHLGIVLADVSGKGVHAALVVAMMRSAFRTQARGTTDVRDVLAGVNDFISEDLPQNMFITCIYGVLEVSSRTFSWARAGHEPLIVAHPHAPCELMSPEGFALGVIGSPDFRDMLQVQSVHLDPGDRILLFTDGLTEAMNSRGEEFGMQRILDVLDPAHHGINGAANGTINGTSNGKPTIVVAKSDKPSSPNMQKSSSNGPRLGSTNSSREDERQRFGHTPESSEPPCAPGLSVDEPEDLKMMERAVAAHVGDAPQSDDLTLVYLEAVA